MHDCSAIYERVGVVQAAVVALLINAKKTRTSTPPIFIYLKRKKVHNKIYATFFLNLFFCTFFFAFSSAHFIKNNKYKRKGLKKLRRSAKRVRHRKFK